ncbi:hypothetical protein K438DRAFT_1755117 [Mycena galopus ATCC 62051]|nr:hypothetical protein K438DRAFT_1755117 [Mycena galopus ATCC 62051]
MSCWRREIIALRSMQIAAHILGTQAGRTRGAHPTATIHVIAEEERSRCTFPNAAVWPSRRVTRQGSWDGEANDAASVPRAESRYSADGQTGDLAWTLGRCTSIRSSRCPRKIGADDVELEGSGGLRGCARLPANHADMPLWVPEAIGRGTNREGNVDLEGMLNRLLLYPQSLSPKAGDYDQQAEVSSTRRNHDDMGFVPESSWGSASPMQDCLLPELLSTSSRFALRASRFTHTFAGAQRCSGADDVHGFRRNPPSAFQVVRVEPRLGLGLGFENPQAKPEPSLEKPRLLPKPELLAGKFQEMGARPGKIPGRARAQPKRGRAEPSPGQKAGASRPQAKAGTSLTLAQTSGVTRTVTRGCSPSCVTPQRYDLHDTHKIELRSGTS